MEIAHWVTITVAAIAVIIIFVGAAYQERFEEVQAERDATKTRAPIALAN